MRRKRLKFPNFACFSNFLPIKNKAIFSIFVQVISSIVIKQCANSYKNLSDLLPEKAQKHISLPYSLEKNRFFAILPHKN